MLAKRYLYRVRQIEGIVNKLKKEIRKWEGIANAMPSSISSSDKVQTSNNQDKLSTAVCEYLTLKERYLKEVAVLYKEKEEILNTLKQLPTSEYDVLYGLYIENVQYYEVADRNDRGISWVKKKRATGLKLLQEILDERKE